MFSDMSATIRCNYSAFIIIRHSISFVNKIIKNVTIHDLHDRFFTTDLVAGRGCKYQLSVRKPSAGRGIRNRRLRYTAQSPAASAFLCLLYTCLLPPSYTCLHIACLLMPAFLYFRPASCTSIFDHGQNDENDNRDDIRHHQDKIRGSVGQLQLV